LFSFGVGPASSVDSESEESATIWVDFFFLLENNDGNGWLMDREWAGRWGRRGCRSSSDELEPAWIW
jgi:hypothetical protein